LGRQVRREIRALVKYGRRETGVEMDLRAFLEFPVRAILRILTIALQRLADRLAKMETRE